MTLLSRNVYGTDIASCKLWLATFLLQHGDYCRSLQNVNYVLSSIPPYALYYSGIGIKLGDESTQLYIDRYSGRNMNILCRAKEAWLFDMRITHSEYSFVPRAIQIALDYCDPFLGVRISPFIYTYYLMFLCYHGLGQYDNRDRALRQLVDTANDYDRNGVSIHHSYNIAGHCMLIAGDVDMGARHVSTVSMVHTAESSLPINTMLHINTCLLCDPISGFLVVCDNIEHVDSVVHVRIREYVYHENLIFKLLLLSVTYVLDNKYI